MAPEDRPFQFVREGRLHFFCPLCHYHQSTSTIQKVQARHHAQIALLTLATTLACFPWFGYAGALLYLVYWTGFEFVYRLRKRQALICESCGFDPFLYKQDLAVARKALRQHWETRIEKEKLFSGMKLKNYQTAPREAAIDAPAEGAPPGAGEARPEARPPA